MNNLDNVLGEHTPHKSVGIIGHGGEVGAVVHALDNATRDTNPIIINCNTASMSGAPNTLNPQVLDEVMKDLKPKQTLIIEDLSKCFQYTPTVIDEDKVNEHQHMLSCHKGRKKRKRKK